MCWYCSSDCATITRTIAAQFVSDVPNCETWQHISWLLASKPSDINSIMYIDVTVADKLAMVRIYRWVHIMATQVHTMLKCGYAFDDLLRPWLVVHMHVWHNYCTFPAMTDCAWYHAMCKLGYVFVMRYIWCVCLCVLLGLFMHGCWTKPHSHPGVANQILFTCNASLYCICRAC